MTEFLTADDRVTVDVWFDVMCPFCYIGTTVLTQATEQFEHPVEVRHHSYRLMPELSEETAVGMADLLMEQRGMSHDQIASMNAAVTARAADVGLHLSADQTVAINTKTAHRLIHFAATEGLQTQMVERLFRAYFVEGSNVGDHATLADLAAEVGLDRAEALRTISSDAFGAAFDDDVRQAQRIGVTGVPFFVIDGKFAVSGAQSAETFTSVLQRAWDSRAESATGAR